MEKLTSACSWACHDDTNHCKKHHVKLLNDYYEITDPLYFGIINSMKKTGNYGLANIIVLAFIIPMIVLALFIRALDTQEALKKLT